MGEPEQRLIALGEAVHDIVFVTDLEGRMLWANRRLTEETGYVAADFAFEQPDNPFLHPDDAANVGRVIAEVVSSSDGSPGRVENRFRDKWGRVHLYRSTIQKTTWEAAPALLFSVRSAEPASAPPPSDESYRRIVEGANDGILKMSADGRIHFANARLLDIFGLTPVELGKRSFAELVLPCARERVASTVAGVAQRGASTTFEIRFAHPSGEIRSAEINASRLDDGDDRGLVLALVRDASTAHRLALAMREAQKLESVGVVASGIAHDFRNIVSAVLYGVTAAERAPSAGGRGEALAVVREAAERAAQLTSSLLAYVGRSDAKDEVLELGELVAAHERLLRAVIARNADLRIEPSEGPVRTSGNTGQVAQVLLNLVTNGAEALEGREGRVTVETKVLAIGEAEDGSWRPSAPAPGRYAALVVSDTGKGISEEARARIFDTFFTTKQHGRGLGLAAVMAVVRTQNGAVRTESEPGKGSTFTVVLGPALPG